MRANLSPSSDASWGRAKGYLALLLALLLMTGIAADRFSSPLPDAVALAIAESEIGTRDPVDGGADKDPKPTMLSVLPLFDSGPGLKKTLLPHCYCLAGKRIFDTLHRERGPPPLAG